MDNNIFNEIGTTLDLNGPILSFSEQPTGATGIGTTIGATGGASVSFTGIATGVDPGTGYLSYQWYEENVGKLSDSTYITGTASTGSVGTASTLTISNLITPTDNQRKFYVVVDYVSSAYGTGRSTGNAWNEPLSSGIATATVTPLIDIVSQPTEGVQAFKGDTATISVNADLTDSYFADDLTYQWYLNGEVAVDGVKTVTTTTSGSASGSVDFTATRYNSHAFPAVGIDNLEITVVGGSGGNGGNDSGGPGGRGAQGRAGKFSLPGPAWLGKTLYTFVGWKGNDGGSGSNQGSRNGRVEEVEAFKGDGGLGGRSSRRGWSGAGGGGGALSCISENRKTSSGIIIAGGGAGGGGGSWQRAGGPGNSAPPFESVTGSTGISKNPRRDGKNAGSDGGGGGGGGGGVPGGDGGEHGVDRVWTSYGGNSGHSVYDSESATILSEWTSSGNGYINIKYTGYTSQEVTTTTKTTISGATSNTLSISADYVGVQTCQCKITSATASNSPIWTDVTNFVTTSTVDEYNLVVEDIGIGKTASISNIDLNNGEYTFETAEGQVASGSITKYYSFYAPDKDIDVEMDLYGGKGINFADWPPERKNSSWGSGSEGGEGGYSRIRFTMKQNEEYVIVGLSTDSVNTPFLYNKGKLIACVGQGGEGGHYGRGGFGGGVGVAGEDGQGRLSGEKGDLIQTGNLTNNGFFGSSVDPTVVYPGDNSGRPHGQTIRCTKGVYWAQQGIGACDDIGTGKFRLPDGTVVNNTVSGINRGFKAGYNIMETSGAKDANGGLGGNGATGGSGGSQGGGGGGSGYNDGSVTVVDTQQGGSAANAKVILRVVT